MTDYDKLEERRQMARSNYYAQLAMMGYDSSGNALDSVKITRCRNCKHRQEYDPPYSRNECDLVFPDDVCPMKCGDSSWMAALLFSENVNNIKLRNNAGRNVAQKC